MSGRHLLAAVAAATLFTTPGPAAEIPIRGRVTDETGAGLAAARVELVPVTSSLWDGPPEPGAAAAPEPAATARSDAEGSFQLSAPSDGMWRVVVRASGRVPQELVLEPLLATSELPAAALLPDAGLAVQVTDGAGRPLAGVRVVASAFRSPRSSLPAGRWEPAVRCAVTGDDGAATLPHNRREPLSLSAFKSGYRGATQAPLAAESVTLRLQRARERTSVPISAAPLAISGRVLAAPAGRPLAGALVWTPTDPGGFVRTDADGRYTLLAAAGGRSALTIRAAAAGFFAGEEQIAAGERGRELTLEPTAALAGTVIDESKAAVEGAEVVVTTEPGATAQSPFYRPASASYAFTRSGPGGRFRLPVVANRSYRLVASKRGYETVRREVSVADHRPARTPLEVVLRRRVTGYGRVLDGAERPVPGAEVRLWPLDEEPSGADARRLGVADGEGRFELTELAPGRFDLEVRARGFAPVTIPGVDVVAGHSRQDLGTVILEPGVVVEGQVLDAGGEAIRGASVHCFPGPGTNRAAERFDPSRLPPAVTDAEGVFVIEDRRPGERLALRISAPGYADGSADEVRVPTEPLRFVLEPAATLRGQVVDASRRTPLPQARVAVSHERGAGRVAVADEEGDFELGGIEPGRVRLEAVADGFQPFGMWLRIAPGDELGELRIALEPGAAVEGRVVRGDDQAVVGAVVRAVDQPPGTLADAVTDDHGHYRLAGLAPGEHTIELSHPGYPRQVKHIELTAGTRRLDFYLGASREVNGWVGDEAGMGLGGVDLELRALDSGVRRQGVSAADGSFALREVADGTYRLRAWKEGYATTVLAEEVRVAGEPLYGLEVWLTTGAELTGRVLGLDFDQFAGLRIEALGPDDDRKTTTVDYEGRYRLANLAAGRWTLVAETQGGQTARGSVVLEPAATGTELDLEFPDRLSLRGRIAVNGEPLAGAEVSARGQEGGPEAAARSDHRGEFVVEGLEPGKYLVEIRHPEQGIQHSREIELPAEEEITVELTRLRLSGQVVDASDSTPIAEALVWLQRPTAASAHGLRGGHTVRSDVRGRFFFRVDAGTYRLQARRTGYAAVERTVRVGDSDVEGIELALAATEGLTLEVGLAAGGWPDRVHVAALDQAGRPVLAGSFQSADHGRVRLASLPAGSWQLLVSAAGTATVTQREVSPGGVLPVVLPPGASIEVEVPDLAGSPAAATLTVTSEDGSPFQAVARGGAVQWAWPVRSGRAWVRGLSPGTWKLRVAGAEGISWGGTAVISAGEVLRVVLDED